MQNETSQSSQDKPDFPVLTILYGPEMEREFIINKPLVTIGRGEDRDIQFSDRALSRRHCEILYQGGVLTIRDAGSQNGIKVNGRTTMEQVLKDGDLIDIGSTRLVVNIPSEQEETK